MGEELTDSLGTGGRFMSNDLTIRETGLRQGTCLVRSASCDCTGMWRDPEGGPGPPNPVLSQSEGLDHAEEPPAASWLREVLSERYGFERPGVCQDDGQTEAEVVPSQCECGDALLRRKPPYLT